MRTILFLLLLLVPLSTVEIPETSPPPTTIPTLHKCPGYYICFYQNKDFGGKMIKSQKLGWSDMAKVKFQDVTSSWVDNAPYLCQVEVTAKDRETVLWYEGGETFQPWVGKKNNDRAWWFFIAECD